MAKEDDLTRKIRWKLALGNVDESLTKDMSTREKQVDQVLDRLYRTDRTGGLTKSHSISAKWMGEIKSIFPTPVVRILQRDALDRFGIRKLLAQPAFLNEIEPDVGLIASILSVKESLSPTALQSARYLVSKLARQIEQELKFKVISRISGVRDRKLKIKNANHHEIDWHLTIKQNLKYYQPELKTIIPENILGRPRRKNQSKRIIILVDQSASMAESLIYACILGSILATIRSIKTHLIVFDTEVVDLTEYLTDPVELLMQSQLGGGTHIEKALRYATKIIETNPGESHLVLLSDLFEGGPKSLLLERVWYLIDKCETFITLLALDDHGAPAYDKEIAKEMVASGTVCFACTPDRFAELITKALNGEELSSFTNTLQ